MHNLIRNIIKEVLAGEKGVALIAGGFKPPTKGHYELVMGAANHPNVSEVKVFIGNAVRDGITAEISKEIWDLYPLPDNVSVEVSPTPSPIDFIYKYLKSHPDEKIYFVGGVRDEEDVIDLEKKSQSAKKKYPNVEILAVNGKPTVSGTKARRALLNNNKELFFTYLPDFALPHKEDNEITKKANKANKEVKEKVWTLLTQQ